MRFLVDLMVVLLGVEHFQNYNKITQRMEPWQPADGEQRVCRACWGGDVGLGSASVLIFAVEEMERAD